MKRARIRSLKSLLLGHELVLLLLIVMTALIGGVWAYFWQQTSTETLRLTALSQTANHIRTDIFRQIKEVTVARLMEDQKAARVYSDYSMTIDQYFNTLRARTKNKQEGLLVQEMQVAYSVIQHDMNRIFSSPYLLSRSVRLRILDARYEKQLVGDFETAFEGFEAYVEQQRELLAARMQSWIKLARLLIPAALVLAVILILFSRRLLQTAFVRPMGHLTDGAHRISAGQLDARVPQQGVQEVSDLAGAMNHMASELVNSQAALVESERQAALGALVPVVAHNIRNPLAAIRANVQLLDGDDSADDILETRRAVIETVDRLERWVSSLVSYLHPLEPHRREADLRQVLKEPMALLSNRLHDKQMTANWSLPEDDCLVSLDVDLMEQVFYNLYSNAIDASPPDSQLTVALLKAEDDWQVHIIDQGGGMPFCPTPSDLEPGPSTKRFGTGLGIPIAFKVCKTHGWGLAFDGIDEGGTRVRVTIPAASLVVNNLSQQQATADDKDTDPNSDR